MDSQIINITFDDKIKHVSVHDGVLKKSILREYYPDGATLIYKENNEIFLLETDKDNIFVKPNINDYFIEVRIATQEARSTCTQQADLVKRRKINEYLSKIQNKPGITDEVELKSKQKLSKVNDLRVVRTNPRSITEPLTRSVYVGWKHRFSEHTKYKHQKGEVGGLKEFLLNSETSYSVQDLLKMSINAFKHPVAVKKMQMSHCKLGFFNGKEIKEFMLPDSNTPCGLWDFFKLHFPSSSRINLYILSTLEEKYLESSEEENEPMEGGFDAHKVVPKLPAIIEKTTVQPLQNVTNILENKTEAVDEGQDLLHKTTINEEDLPRLSNLQEVPAKLKVIKQNYNKIDILYLLITTSKYSNEVVINESELQELYYRVISNEDEIYCGDIESFDPVDHGFQLVVNENMDFHYLYPSFADIGEDRNHSIIYDIDELIGYNNDNFGIGVIPKCEHSCRPIISWFEDGILKKKGHMLIWMNCVSIGYTWHCEIECSSGIKMKSKTIFISEEQELCFKFNPLEVSEVNKNNFNQSTEKIGKGQQGIVYKGNFNHQEVAIKVIKVFSKKTERIEQEIKALKSINHENFIKLLAVCKEVKKFSLITTYFESEKLSDFIFDDDIKEKLGGLCDFKKRFISLQICRAIAYLHNRSQPILHCDVKPDNILINNKMVIKICDFGLSKFTTEVTVLNKNTIGAVVGTLSYIAPEILIDHKPASTATDVWSTACTLAEVYKEELIWDADEDELKEKLQRHELPNLDKINDAIKAQVIQCFSYNPKERPCIIDIYNILHN